MKAKYEPTSWIFKPGATPLEANTPHDVTGATVKSPNESNWYLVPSKYYGVNFGRKYGQGDETVIASTTIHKFEGLASDRDFLNHVAEQRLAQSDDSRSRVLRAENEFVTFKNSACFNYEWLSRDHGDTGIDSNTFQYFSAIGYICRHPYNSVIAFQMEVSYRGNNDAFPEDMRAVSREFFEDIKFNRREGLDEIK
jgi:hypothetical protein